MLEAEPATEATEDIPSVPQNHLYKVLVLGDFGVGKTSIITRYTSGTYSPNYKLTIGVDFATKILEWDSMRTVTLQLWDVAGHERFGHMTRSYYRYAIAAVVVFDLTRLATFDAVKKWIDDVNSKVMLANESHIPIILLANKSDMSTEIDDDTIEAFCQLEGLVSWYKTSAKDNIGIDDAMFTLVSRILKLNTDIADRPDEATLRLEEAQHRPGFLGNLKRKWFTSDCATGTCRTN